ncbi:type 4 pilus major pilin [Pseudaquabacterium terrae]|uniref:type 4 pilus major pilin n=1 Tax=Pseudaquabacterium terrae TaxID=2732868 RepID=UPI001FE9EC4C|nr:type 4 pilus major pilin [Aquabacterium terrae]
MKSNRTAKVSIVRAAQRGASLLESIAFLGIAAIVILGAVALLLGGFSSANSNRAETEVNAIRTGVKRLFMGQSASYGTANMNATLINAKVFPTSLSMDTGTNAVNNAWNGAVTVVGATQNFLITYAAVPKSVCIDLVAAGGDWIGVKVNGGASLTMPVTPTAATTACNAAANSIEWTGN